MSNRTLVSAATLFVAIILGITITTTADARFLGFGSKNPKPVTKKVHIPRDVIYITPEGDTLSEAFVDSLRQAATAKKHGKLKPAPVTVIVVVPADVKYVDQYGQRVSKPRTSATATSTPTATSSYENNAMATEGGWGLTTDARREWGTDGKPSGTSVGIGLAVGRYSASVRSDGSSSFSNGMMDGYTSGYGFYPSAPMGGSSMYTGQPFRPACYNGYQTNQLVAVYLYSDQAADTQLKLRDSAGNEFDVPVLGCSARDRSGTTLFVPPGSYSFKLAASGWNDGPMSVPNPYRSGWQHSPAGRVALVFPVNPYVSGACASTPYSTR